MPIPPKPLPEVIGDHARQLRLSAGLTLDQVAVATKVRGLNWTESRVADFESGRVAANLATLVSFCLVLTDVGCTATVPDLVGHTRLPIQINDGLTLWSADVVDVMSGRPVTNPKRVPGADHRDAENPSDLITKPREMHIAGYYADRLTLTKLSAVWRATGATEKRISKSLGISPMLLANLSAALWKRSFSEERDRRAGEGANAQKRGQVSREMQAEVDAAISRVPDGNDK